MYEISFLNIRFYKVILKICVIDWQRYHSLCDTLLLVYLTIRHCGFYSKCMIRHYLIHLTIRAVGFYTAISWNEHKWILCVSLSTEDSTDGSCVLCYLLIYNNIDAYFVMCYLLKITCIDGYCMLRYLKKM